MSESDRRISSISRRAFLAAGSAGLVAGRLLPELSAEPIAPHRPAPGAVILHPAPRKRLTEIPAELLRQVHPEMRYERVELPQDQNALTSLQAACQQFQYYHEFLFGPPYNLDWASEPPFYKRYEEFEKGGPFPIGEWGQAIRKWIVVNQRIVDLMDESIQRGHLQLSVGHLLNWFDDLWADKLPLRGINAVARFRKVRARLFFVDGDVQRGLIDILKLLRLGKVVGEGDVLPLHRIFGQGLQRAALELIGELACAGSLPDDVAVRMIRELPHYELSATSLKQQYRVEFGFSCLASWEQLPSAPLQELVDSYILYHMYCAPNIKTLKLSGVTDNDIRRVRRELMTILRDHTRPYDKLETAHLSTGLAADSIRDLSRPYIERRRNIAMPVAKDITAWPSHLCWSNAPNSSLPANNGRAILTEAQLEAARRALAKVNNPLGKKLAIESVKTEGSMLHHSLAANRALLGATSIVLACRRKLDRDGKLPERLDDLVNAKMIETMPLDPFSGKPFRYSRERALLWSVGEDGQDDDGDWDFDATPFPTGKDIVWRLPQPKTK